MRGFNIKLKTIDLDFELDIEEFEDKDKDFIREILRMIDRKATTPKEEDKINELKENYKNALIGYNTLAKDFSGYHRGVDEYIARTVEEQFTEELSNTNESSAIKKNTTEEQTESTENLEKQAPVDKSDEKEDTNNNTPESHPSIRLNQNKDKLYQSYYICNKCSNKGKRYIPRQSLFISCHNCSQKMRIAPATSKGFPHPDSFGNIFIAGKFIREEDKEKHSEQDNRITQTTEVVSSS